MTTHIWTRWRPARRGAALALGLALGIAGAELLYRGTRLSALSPTTNPNYVEHDDELGWSYRPHAREHHMCAEFDVEVAINAQGFRGPDWPELKRERRVLVLGDSQAFGWGVRWEETFAARLQAAHPEWEVLDAAVSGYATDQELLLLRRLRARVQPDLVVCVFCANDTWEANSTVAYGKSKPRFIARGAGLELENVPVPEPWLERTSALWRAWQKKRWEHAFEERVRDTEQEWRVVLALYRTMRDELASSTTDASRSGTVALVIVSAEDRLVEFARAERGVRHLDVRPVLGASAEPTAFPVDGHWNAHGHALVSRALERELMQELK